MYVCECQKISFIFYVRSRNSPTRTGTAPKSDNESSQEDNLSPGRPNPAAAVPSFTVGGRKYMALSQSAPQLQHDNINSRRQKQRGNIFPLIRTVHTYIHTSVVYEISYIWYYIQATHVILTMTHHAQRLRYRTYIHTYIHTLSRLLTLLKKGTYIHNTCIHTYIHT